MYRRNPQLEFGLNTQIVQPASHSLANDLASSIELGVVKEPAGVFLIGGEIDQRIADEQGYDDKNRCESYPLLSIHWAGIIAFQVKQLLPRILIGTRQLFSQHPKQVAVIIGP